MSHSLRPFLLGIGFSLFVINLTTAHAAGNDEPSSNLGATAPLHASSASNSASETKQLI